MLRTNMLRLSCMMLLAFAAGCGGSDTEATTVPTRTARWDIDHDANLAVPVCPDCGEAIARDHLHCDKCKVDIRIEAKTIPCPECAGKKMCVHCGAHHSCATCDGTHNCACCEGTGRLDGEACPDCGGSKACTECGPGVTRPVCEACNGDEACTNCAGKGTITLK